MREEVKRRRRRKENGMCPKRRMHAETRKRYIRGLATGDERPRYIHMRKRDTLAIRRDDISGMREKKKRERAAVDIHLNLKYYTKSYEQHSRAVNVLTFDERGGTTESKSIPFLYLSLQLIYVHLYLYSFLFFFCFFHLFFT